MKQILLVILLIWAAFGLMATGALAADVKAGQTTFKISCQSCHGQDGTPNADVAKTLKADMRDLKSAEVQRKSDDDIKKVITQGTGKMVPIHTVSGADLDNVVAYIRSLKK
jgi:mono/diheme cytochrome c family protein